jgi:hypothetical protein
VMAKDVERALRRDPETWKHFAAFPEEYRRIRMAYVEAGRGRPGEFERRLANLVKKTSQGKRFGYVREFR